MHGVWLKYLVGEMSQSDEQSIRLQASISGEIQPGDIPLNSSIDIMALKAGDTEPLEVVVEVPAGKSKRGWNYKPKALQSIVGEVMNMGLPGFLGHQKPEDVATEFPLPATHWVGAKWDENGNKAYFRGVIDKAAADLKRWIKAKTINTVSIFGQPKLAKSANGEVDVVDYKGLSIDWTPLGRAGMPTAVVATGEMDQIVSGELDGSFDVLRTEIAEAARVYFGLSKDEYAWVRELYYDDQKAIIEYESSQGDRKLYSIPYQIKEKKVVLGEKTEVVERRVFEPVAGEMGKGGNDMNWEELVANLKAMLASKKVTLGQIIGEMGFSVTDLAGEMVEVKTALETEETLTKIREALGVSGEMDVVQVATDAAKAVVAQRLAAHESLINEVLADKVSGEMAQGIVRKMLNVAEDATKEQIAGEIDTLLADETVKGAISKLYVEKPAGAGSGGANESTTLRTKRQGI